VTGRRHFFGCAQVQVPGYYAPGLLGIADAPTWARSHDNKRQAKHSVAPNFLNNGSRPSSLVGRSRLLTQPGGPTCCICTETRRPFICQSSASWSQVETAIPPNGSRCSTTPCSARAPSIASKATPTTRRRWRVLPTTTQAQHRKGRASACGSGHKAQAAAPPPQACSRLTALDSRPESGQYFLRSLSSPAWLHHPEDRWLHEGGEGHSSIGPPCGYAPPAPPLQKEMSSEPN
jgi:hypothetical protein